MHAVKLIYRRVAATAAGVFLPFCAFAADIPQDNALDMIIEKFKTQTMTWEPVIHHLTMTLFWGLALISFAWTFIQMVMKDGTGLVDIVAELTRRVLLIGFTVWLMNEAPNLARTLIDSFVHVGNVISGGKVAFSPSNVLELGINIITIIEKSSSLLDIGGTIAMWFSAFVVLLCFSQMAMEMTVLIISGYIIVSGGIVSMGFLGSDWTRDHAMNYFHAVLGVAFKMFIMQLVFIVGYTYIQEWGASIQEHSSSTDVMVLLGCSIVFAGMIREIPSMAASLASGQFTGNGGGIASTLTNIAAAAAGATLMMTAAAGMMSGKSGGSSDSSGGSGDPAPEPDTLPASTMDTGPGDDGKAYDAYLASQNAASSPSSGSSSPDSGGGDGLREDSGKGYEPRQNARKARAKGGAGAMAKGTLEAIASHGAVGNALAKGADGLKGGSGRKPEDKPEQEPPVSLKRHPFRDWEGKI